jgi:hypothetical protein
MKLRVSAPGQSKGHHQQACDRSTDSHL